MNRLEKFNSLKEHSWYGKQFEKLTKKDIDFCLGFLEENKESTREQYWNTLKMINPNNCKSKADKRRLMICLELLDCSKDI